MPRPKRVQFAGAAYHVMSRGVRGEALYTDIAERREFLALFAETCRRYEWHAFGYCLMGNHYHLLIRTIEPTLSRGMQWLIAGYARSFNNRHGHEGHALFRRFHSVLIESDRQLVDTLRYVLRNPVAAGLCAHADQWRWSSYAATVGLAARPPFLDTTWLDEQFGTDVEHARANFVAFIRAQT